MSKRAISVIAKLCLLPSKKRGCTSPILGPRSYRPNHNFGHVEWLLYINIAFSLIVILYNAKVLQKRFIADAISGQNLL